MAFLQFKISRKIFYKYKNLCETNDPVNFKEKIDEKHLNLDEIKKKIENQIDIIGRNDNFTKIVLNENFPEYLLNNKQFYKEWLI